MTQQVVITWLQIGIGYRHSQLRGLSNYGGSDPQHGDVTDLITVQYFSTAIDTRINA